MRIGLLADLHANREAVEACLDALREAGCTRWVFLGDLVGYGADPGWVVDCVRDHVEVGAHAVLGNHDEAALAAGSAPMHGEAEAAMAWTRTRLDQAQKAFLGGLPLTIHDEDRFYAHANAWDPGGWAYVHNRLAAARSLSATRERLSFCVHLLCMLRVARSWVRTATTSSGVRALLRGDRRFYEEMRARHAMAEDLDLWCRVE